MKYNEKYDRWVTKGGLVYRYDFKQDKLVLCNLNTDKDGYLTLKISKPKSSRVKVHRLVYETFVDEIPQGYQIDHINTIKDDNRVENLRVVTPKENNNNPLTRKHKSESLKGNTNAKGSKSKRGKTFSVFGRKFKEHFGISRFENIKLYNRERMWYCNHNNKCRWEE